MIRGRGADDSCIFRIRRIQKRRNSRDAGEEPGNGPIKEEPCFRQDA